MHLETRLYSFSYATSEEILKEALKNKRSGFVSDKPIFKI
jgi:hypothetical protein